MNKILQFPNRFDPSAIRPTPVISYDPSEHATQILDLTKTHIHAERFTGNPHIENFFEVLTQTKEGVILFDEVLSRDSVLKTGIGRLQVLDITVGEFVSFVSVLKEGIMHEDTRSYLSAALEWLGIQFQVIPMSADSSKVFKIHEKNLQGLDLSTDLMAQWSLQYVEGYCNVGIFANDDEDFEFWAEVTEFRKPIGLPLLYLLTHLREEFVVNGYDLRSTKHYVCIEKYLWAHVQEYNIEVKILDILLLSAIKKLTPQFAHFTDARCISEFYEQMVRPKIKDEEMV